MTENELLEQMYRSMSTEQLRRLREAFNVDLAIVHDVTFCVTRIAAIEAELARREKAHQ